MSRESSVQMQHMLHRYTSDRKLPAMEERTLEDEGMKMYHSCLQWARRLKSAKNTTAYNKFRIECNKKSIEMGYIKTGGGQTNYRGSSINEDDSTDELVVPSLDLDDADMLPTAVVGV